MFSFARLYSLSLSLYIYIYFSLCAWHEPTPRTGNQCKTPPATKSLKNWPKATPTEQNTPENHYVLVSLLGVSSATCKIILTDQWMHNMHDGRQNCNVNKHQHGQKILFKIDLHQRSLQLYNPQCAIKCHCLVSPVLGFAFRGLFTSKSPQRVVHLFSGDHFLQH